MKLKKQLASLAVMGMMSLVAVSSAFASGVGVVNFDTLVQSHKDFPKVSAQMQAAVKDAWMSSCSTFIPYMWAA